MRLPELLAPAGSPEAARAAVQNGADAIYLGGKQFSARQFAENFGDEDLSEILDYCHIYGVKVYLTVNTLVHDREMESALEYLRTLYNAGVDAVIMQDVGLIRAASELLPNLTIHGSTQMTVHNSAGVQFLEEIGVQRVVLAREMSLEDITRVRETTKMELEVFVHGALCIAYSGQCLLSSMIGGRSGNRGKCAQPCRLPYALREMDKGSPVNDSYTHILSPKDLNLIEHLPKLVEAGVAGLKIEGRMKRPEYVAVVVGAYREALDRYAENPDDYGVSPETLHDLAQVFNREFTTGYLYGNPGAEMMSLDRPNNRGIFLGRVQRVDRSTGLVALRIDAPLSVGDEIEFWVTSGGRKEIKVCRLLKGNVETEDALPGEEVQIELNSTKGIHRGDRVFKTSDSQLMAESRQSYTSPVRKRKIPLELQVFLHPGEPLRLTGKDPSGHQVTVSSEVVAQEALKRPITEETLRQQLDRMGNTPFEFSQVDFDIASRVIIPVSEINKARRKLVELFEERRMGKRPAQEVAAKPFRDAVIRMLGNCTSERHVANLPPPTLSVSVADVESAQSALASGAGRVYLGGENLWRRGISNKDVESIVALAQKSGSQVYYSLPRIWHENELEGIKRQAQSLLDKGLTGFSCANLGSLRLLHLLKAKDIHADYPLNVFNTQAACFFRDKGAKSYCLSPELNTQEIGQFGMMLKDAECVVHGWPPLMVSRHCVLNSRESESSIACAQACKKSFGLKDRMNLTFPLKTDSGCRMYIYNSKELCLIENLAELVGYGVRYLRIEAKPEDWHYVERVVTEYDKILKLIKAGVYSDEDGAKARERLEALSPQGITKGHYFRGV